jgi:PAS domain S-box-containing protein
MHIDVKTLRAFSVPFGILLTAGIFLLDLMAEAGKAVGTLYVLPLILTLWMPRKRATVGFALAGTILVIIGAFVGPGGSALDLLLFNRIIALGMIWLAMVFILQHHSDEKVHARLAAIVDSSDDAIISKALDGTILTWNAAAERIFGYSWQEMKGRTTACLFPPDRLEEELRHIERIKQGDRVEHFETVRWRKDGREIDVAMTISPIKNASGEIIALSKIARDITARKQAERRLGAEHAVAHTLANSLTLEEATLRVLQAVCESIDWDVGVLWSLDPEAQVLRCTEFWCRPSVTVPVFEQVTRELVIAEGVGLPGRAWSSGRPAWIRDVSEDQNFPRAIIAKQEGLHAGTAFPIALGGQLLGVMCFLSREIREPDEAQMAMMSAIGSQVGQFMQVKQAQREAAKLQEQLFQSQKMEAVGRLAGGVAHDFNNLLTAIIGYSELLLSRIGSRSEIEHIREAGRRAALLTRQLLAFSRREVIEPKLLNLNDVLDNLEPLLRRLIGEDVELTITLDSSLSTVKADVSQFEQIIMNLAVNARDAMPSGGRLVIETRNVELDAAYVRTQVAVASGPYIQLTVTDTGCGMDAATQARIFEPFFTTKSAGKGTGLGLAMVYGIVTQNGGTISVQSEVGKGTTFSVYWPRTEGDANQEPSTCILPEHCGGTETILLVEDDDQVRQWTRTVLEERGYTVLEARHGDEALALYEQHATPIHLLVTDVVMPGMNGRTLADRMSAMHAGLKILFISGYTDNAIVHHGVLEPGTAFVQKPFYAQAFLERVRMILDAAPQMARPPEHGPA